MRATISTIPAGFAVLTLGFLTTACGGGGGPATHPVGKPDQSKTGALQIDESGLKGTVTAGRIRLGIPTTNLGTTAVSTELAVSIIQVDDAKVFQTKQVPVNLPAGMSATVPVDLLVPTGVSVQPDWAKLSVLVEQRPATNLRVTRSLLTAVGSYDVRLEGPSRVTKDRTVSYRVFAEDPTTGVALPDAHVKLTVKKGADVVASYDATTGDKGDAVFSLSLTVVGDATVEASGDLAGTTTVVSGGVAVSEAGGKVLVTTDKPLYQPGQVIHLRAVAIDRVTQKPIGAKGATFEIEDGKGNKILKRATSTDTYGIASTTFKLGNVLNMGTFKVRALVGTDKAEKTVTVSRYALPKFKVDVTPDKPWYTPGQTVAGTVDARYFFGKAAQGADVSIEASSLDIGQTVFARIMGKTDAQGRFPFQVMLPTQLVGLPIQAGSALVDLNVSVVDSAGQKVVQDKAVTVAARALRLAVVPENTVIVPGLANHVDVFVTDPLGNPAASADVLVTDVGGQTIFSGKADAFGQAAFDWTVNGGTVTSTKVLVSATTKDGLAVSEPFDLKLQAGTAHVLVRTNTAVYGLGDTVTVDITTSADQRFVYVDWLNNGQDVDMRTLDVVDGKARFTKTVDTGLVGDNRLEAYVVGPDGNIVRAGRTIFVRDSGGLSVDLATDQPQYTPGAPAKLTFSVKDETGAPAVAAMGVQIVDQAVFALVDAQPGLLRTYFQLEDEFAQPSYEIRPPVVDIQRVVFDETAQADAVAAQAAQVRAGATFASIVGMMTGVHASSAAALIPAVHTTLTPFYDAAKSHLLPIVSNVTDQAILAVRARGCDTTSYYCAATGTDTLQAIHDEVETRLQVYDFWGNGYRLAKSGETSYPNFLRLVTNGPDEKQGTGDDDAINFQASELSLTQQTSPPVGVGDIFRGGMAAPGAANGAAPTGAATGAAGGGPTGAPPPTTPATGAGGAMGMGDTGPRVRNDFPETLYDNPEVITGPDGKATVTLDMADSITEWRVSTLAHSLGGKLGGGVAGVKVFQDFFVDIDFPATLTRGDIVEFPVAIYNYLDKPQTVHVALDPAAWYTATGATTADVTLAAGQVTGIRFPVRVDAVGRQTLTVKALGGHSDAVARSVLVVPDGKAFPLAQSGSLAAGELEAKVTFPANAVPGSQVLYLNVFPAYLSQVVQGMDSLLRVPNGCFEQTTSTAWPNVLVTDYLKQTNQLKPETQLKAESLMSAGYQRLLTFEHKGGGFSWFGEQDPKPFLSVTAFGLMEFSDMAKVQMVDPAMIDRTKTWLAGQQAADGSWAGDMSEFFSFQTSGERNTAFVVWALATSGYQGPELAKGLAYLKGHLDQNADAYTLALVASAYATAASADPFGSQVVDRLAAAAKKNGDKISWDTGGTQTNFYGGGQDGEVASTALVVQALLLTGGHKDLVDGALAFLTGARDSNGNFGSTQATIWTLRALLLAAKMGTEGAVGTFDVGVDGASFGQIQLTKADADVMTTVDMSSLATTGTHTISLTFAGTGKVSYNLVSGHNLPWAALPPPVPTAGPLGVTVAYDKTRLTIDETATATVTVRNNTQQTEDMILVTVGLPPGFQVATEDLDAYKTKGVLSSYELTGKQLILYVSTLRPGTAQNFVYHLSATMPIKASDGGAQVILYYQPEKGATATATTIEVIATNP